MLQKREKELLVYFFFPNHPALLLLPVLWNILAVTKKQYSSSFGVACFSADCLECLEAIEQISPR